MWRLPAPVRHQLPRHALALALAALICLALGLLSYPPGAGAQASTASVAEADAALARAYAPVVRLKEQPASCGIGEPYEPVDIDVLMGNDEIALRGPWDDTNVVAVAPDAENLSRGLIDYHLDFPGDALDPGCTYEVWSKRLRAERPATGYAHVTSEAGFPGKLALQYWLYYVFNDWKNTHEGDWEMIQLVFDAGTSAAALETGPSEVIYSQHSSAERADWGDEKLEIVDRTHPVVYPASGSHANFFESELHLQRGSAEGVGCDDTTGPSRTIRPAVATVPAEPADYLVAYPWLGFEGRWGERQAGFFNGPTGPNAKDRWTRPITWASENSREESFAVPAGGALGTSATGIFCGAVGFGSEVARRVVTNTTRSALVIGGLAVLLLWGLSRTVWRPAAPLRVARRRAWGQIMSAAARMLAGHPRTFLGIGLLFIPLGILTTAVQYLVFRIATLEPLVDEAGVQNAFVATLALGLGLLFTLFGFAVVQAATAWAMVEIDAGRGAGAIDAYRSVLGRLRALIVALAIAAVVLVVLDLSVVLLPVAILLVVRWSLLGVTVGVEGRPERGALRRSAALVRGQWWRVASVVAVAVAALFTGPLVGVLVLVASGATFDLVNLIAALVYVSALPFAAIALGYLYFDLRVRSEAAGGRANATGDLPSELRTPISSPLAGP